MIKRILTLVKKYRVALLYRRCRKTAQLKANTLNCRIYCVKVNGRPRLITRQDLKHLRASRQVPKYFSAVHLMRIALFWVDPSQHR